MELLEAATGALTAEEIKVVCPLAFDCQELIFEDENLEVDDVGAQINTIDRGSEFSYAYFTQKSDGGTLGHNIQTGSIGSPGTFLTTIKARGSGKVVHVPRGIYYRKYYNYAVPRMDTSTTQKRIKMTNDASMPPAGYPFTVAAHHLIPGNESLKVSKLWDLINKTDDPDRRIISYKGETKIDKPQTISAISTAKGTWKIAQNVGYNVNGAHNGVWLPGNYAMIQGRNPDNTHVWKKQTEDWRKEYIYRVSKEITGQFHDRHTTYSRAIVKNLLDPIGQALRDHLMNCPECQKKKGQEISPPYPVIHSLFKASAWLKRKVSGTPAEWLTPYLTTDKWHHHPELLAEVKTRLSASEA